MISRQLELGFQQPPRMHSVRQTVRRSSRAQWWFEKMHGAVEDAREWPTTVKVSKPQPPVAAPPNFRAPSSGLIHRSQGRRRTDRAPGSAYRWGFSRIRRLVWE